MGEGSFEGMVLFIVPIVLFLSLVHILRLALMMLRSLCLL